MGKRLFLIDFDCTITHNDTTDELLKIYNPKLLEEYQEKFRNGELTVKKYLWDLITSLNINEEEYKKSVAKNVIVDKYFREFTELGEKFRIVSAGTVLNIVSVLEANNIYVNKDNIYSNDVIFEDGRILIKYPYEYNSSFYGISKGSIVDKYKEKGYEVIFIGDGIADIEASKHADILFAKVGRSLEKHCILNNIKFTAYRDFSDIIKKL